MLARAPPPTPRGHEAEDNNPFSLLTLVIIQHQYHRESAPRHKLQSKQLAGGVRGGRGKEWCVAATAGDYSA